MGNLLTEYLDLPPPDPNEKEELLEITLTPPEKEEAAPKSVNLVGRLFGPHRLVLMAIEGVTGVSINIQGTADAQHMRRVSPGDKFHVTLRVCDTPTRALLRLNCAERDVRRLWEVPANEEKDEVFIRQVRMGKILTGHYDPANDEVDRFDVDEEEARIKSIYEVNLNLPELTGEDDVMFQAKVKVPPTTADVNWVTRITQGGLLKTLTLKTGCEVELKEKVKGKEAYLEIQANDEPDRATARLKACMAEAKKLFEGELAADDLDQSASTELRKLQKREEHQKTYAKIAQFLAAAKSNAASAKASSSSKTGPKFDGIMGPSPTPNFLPTPPPPLLVNQAPRHPSPVDAIGPIRNVGHGKGHRFHPVAPGGYPLPSHGFGGGMGGMSGGLGGSFGDLGGAGGETVFVYNLGPDSSEVDLYSLFGRFGAIAKADVPKHKDKKSRGFGFVTFVSAADALRAVDAMDGHPFEKNGNRSLQVSIKTKSSADGKTGGKNSGGYSSMMEAGAGGLSSPFGSPLTSGYNALQPGAFPMDYDSTASTGSYRIFIYNIGQEATELDMYSLCGPFGAVSKVAVVKDAATDKNKGFAFVTFNNYESACAAIRELNGHAYPKNNYRKLQVSFKTDGKSKQN